MINPNTPPALADVPYGMTKSELASILYPGIIVDTALPQDWVNACLDLGFDPRSNFVWGYPDGCALGHPMPLTQEAARDIPARAIPD